ncbi:MAG: type II toxin-antitoxin system RelE/ParE family toxin [Thermomicrobiales bacterium]
MADFPANVRLSSLAREDLEGVLAYTLLTWGEAQMRAYAKRLNRGIARIGMYPEMGRSRPDLGERVRTLPVDAHVIVYTLHADVVVVIRIVSQYQDLESALEESR